MQGNSPDEEYVDPHGECAAEIARLKAQLSTARHVDEKRTAVIEAAMKRHAVEVDPADCRYGEDEAAIDQELWDACEAYRALIAAETG